MLWKEDMEKGIILIRLGFLKVSFLFIPQPFLVIRKKPGDIICYAVTALVVL